MAITSITKDPGAVLPYTINWASPDGTNDGSSADTGWLQGDTIVSSSWEITGGDSGLVKVSDTENTKEATIVLSGGTHNRNYTVTNHIVTAAGYEDERSLIINVANR